MKNNTLYHSARLGCFMYVFNVEDGIAHVAVADYLNDVFTCMLQYKISEEHSIDLFLTELTDENFTTFSVAKFLRPKWAIKADGIGKWYAIKDYGAELTDKIKIDNPYRKWEQKINNQLATV